MNKTKTFELYIIRNPFTILTSLTDIDQSKSQKTNIQFMHLFIDFLQSMLLFSLPPTPTKKKKNL